MNEYKTIDSLLKKFANPIKEDYEALAVSLMKNFSIAKCEKDSEGVRNVKYRIADLEIYLYSTDDTEDVATLSRDCIEGQWFFVLALSVSVWRLSPFVFYSSPSTAQPSKPISLARSGPKVK